MTDPKGAPGQHAETNNLQALRKRAEQAYDQPGGLDTLPGELTLPDNAQQALHELRVHQIELQMQNEELRRIQIDLEASAARYYDFYDNAPVGYLTVDPAGTLRQANFTAASMLDTPRGLLTGRLVSRFIEREDQDLYYLLKKRLADSAMPQTCELRMLKGNASPFWVHMAASQGVDLDGTPVTRLILTDISDRKQAELAVQQSERRYRAIFATSLDAVLLAREDGSTIEANAAACQMFGYTEDEMKTMGRAQLLDLSDPALAAAREGRDQSGNHRGELTFIRKGGVRFPVEVSSSVFMDGDGKPCSSVIIRDISTRRNLERTQATSLLEKDALLKEIHHRVKNNLQIMSSLMRLENSRSASRDVKAVLDDMQGRIRAMALLHETLYKSAVFSDLDLAAYLGELARQAFRALTPTGRDIRLKLDLVPARISLEQATPCGLLMNELISNCLKHGFPQGHDGEIHITLTARGEPPLLRLSVSDTGVGLPADFETRRKTSLGLQLVADLATQLGGELQIGPGPAAEFSVAFTPFALKSPKDSE